MVSPVDRAGLGGTRLPSQLLGRLKHGMSRTTWIVSQDPLPKPDREVGELGTSVITTVERQRQEDQKLKAVLAYVLR